MPCEYVYLKASQMKSAAFGMRIPKRPVKDAAMNTELTQRVAGRRDSGTRLTEYKTR